MEVMAKMHIGNNGFFFFFCSGKTKFKMAKNKRFFWGFLVAKFRNFYENHQIIH